MASITENTRVHTMGDLLMISGTFTDGGVSIDYSPFLSDVIACGAHITDTLQNSTVKINMGGDLEIGETAVVVDTTSALLALSVGQAIYTSLGELVATIATVDDANNMQITAATTAMSNNDDIYVMGTYHPSVTLISTDCNASVDTTNELILIEATHMSASAAAADGISLIDGRWWALGKR